MDVHDKQTRSYNMSCIRNANTKPEIIVRKYLFSQGFRYRLNVRKLPGTPDIVLSKYRTVVFINGCFWHGHSGCKYFVWPQNNSAFWKKKIEQNIKRDEEQVEKLKKLGWNPVVIWECWLKPEKREETLKNLVQMIRRNACE